MTAPPSAPSPRPPLPTVDPVPLRRSRPGPTLGDLAELVRLPAVLSVPGDTLLGAAAAGVPFGPVGIVGRAAASSCLYLGGMALNDYADREVDAVERPHRPIPSGRVHPWAARAVAEALTVAGIAVAGVTGGRRALRVAIPLAATVWAYDLALKDTFAGPATMAACRGLDVLLGASGGDLRPALGPAAVVAVHTLAVTQVSRHEAHGASPWVPRRALWSTAAVSAAAAASIAPQVIRTATGTGPIGATAVPGRRARAAPRSIRATSAAALAAVSAARGPSPSPRRRGRGRTGAGPGLMGRPRRRAVTPRSREAKRPRDGRIVASGTGAAGSALAAGAVPGVLLAAYAVTMGRAGVRALREPSPARLQALVGAGVLGLMPLEGALIASRDRDRGGGRGGGRGRGGADGRGGGPGRLGADGRRRLPVGVGVAVAALWPVARSLARRRAVT